MNPEMPPFARDMDLVREILIWMEGGAPGDERPSADDDLRFGYHCQIMKQAGLIDAAILEMAAERGGGLMVPKRVVVQRLTWQGQEALAAMRSDTVWAAVKAKVAEHGLPMLFDFALGVARGIAGQHGLPMG